VIHSFRLKGNAGRVSRLWQSVWFVLLGGLLFPGISQAGGRQLALAAAAAPLFQETNVWNVHLKFTAEQWAAMEPKRINGGFGGFGGPGGPMGGPGGPPAGGPPKGGQPQGDQPREGPPPGGDDGGGMMLRNPNAKRNGLAGMMGIDFVWAKADLEFDGLKFANVGVRYKGNGTYAESQRQLKRPLKIDLDKNVRGQNLLGITKLNFGNLVADPSCLSDSLSYQLFREAGVPSPRTAHARIYLTVPGKYDHQFLGLYVMVENVDSMYAISRFGLKQGLILKPVTPKLFDYLGEDWATYSGIYDPKTRAYPEQQRRVIEMAKLVTSADDATFQAKIGDFVDLDEFARFLAVTVYLSTMDSILAQGQNYYIYLHPISNKFMFMPWDLDHSFGEFPMIGSAEGRINLSLVHPYVGKNKFLERMLAFEKFKSLYLDYHRQFLNTVYKPEKVHQQLDQIAGVIRPVLKEESEAKLKRFEQAISDQTIVANANDNNPFRGFGPFGGTPSQTKLFITRRANSVADQLAGKSTGQIIERGGFGPPGGGPPGGGPPPGGGWPGGPDDEQDFGPPMEEAPF
jgi:spore coat protein H